MANFVSKIEFDAIDNVSPVAKAISRRIGELGTVSARLDSQLGKVSAAGGVLASRLRNLGLVAAGVATSVFLLANRTSDAAEQLLNLSQKTGVSVEELQRLNYVAEQSNVGTDALATSFRFLNRSIADASSTMDGEAAEAFAGLGINVKDANGQLKSTSDIFFELSDAFSKSEDGPNKVTTAVKLLGRAGSELIPILNQGSTAIQKQGDRFARFGNLMSKDRLKAIADFNDRVKDIQVAFAGLGSIVAEAVIPVLQPLTERFAQFVASNKELIQTNVSQFIGTITEGMAKLWPRAVLVWQTFSGLVEKIGGFSTIIKSIGIYIAGDLIANFVRLGGALVTLGRIFLATPFGVVVAAIGAIGYALFELNKAFPQLGSAFVGTITIMGEKFAAFFEGVWAGIRKILEGLHLIDAEKQKQEGTAPTKVLTSTIGPDGRSTTVLSDAPSAQDASTQNPFAPQSQATGGADQSFAGILQMLADVTRQQQSAMDINLNLNTENKVSNMDIDAPLNANVNVNSGPMLSY